MSRKKKKTKVDQPATAEAAPSETDATDTVEAVDERSPVEVERDELQDKYLRLLAEFQNFQKRSQKERSQERQFANESLIKELLGALDDMERALAAAADRDQDDPFRIGLQMVHDRILDILGRFGLAVIPSVGEPFDPDRHQAMMQEESTDEAPMTILSELQKGYTLNDRTLRPSAVIVAKAPASGADEEDEEKTEG